MIEYELVKGPQDGGMIRFDTNKAVLTEIYTTSRVSPAEYVSWRSSQTKGYNTRYVRVDGKFVFRSKE